MCRMSPSHAAVENLAPRVVGLGRRLAAAGDRTGIACSTGATGLVGHNLARERIDLLVIRSWVGPREMVGPSRADGTGIRKAQQRCIPVSAPRQTASGLSGSPTKSPHP